MRITTAAWAAMGAMCISAIGQQHRAPATPLVTNDPFFNLWSMGDKLTDVPVKHWTEVAQPMLGLIRIDGKAYRWMGTMRAGTSASVMSKPCSRNLSNSPHFIRDITSQRAAWNLQLRSSVRYSRRISTLCHGRSLISAGARNRSMESNIRPT